MSAVELNSTHSCTLVRVSAPARLHLGFLDLNGSNGRKFGSLGLAVNSHSTRLTAKKTENINISAPEGNEDVCKRTESIIQTFYQTLGQHVAEENKGVEITFEQLIPEHAGFGSGTQLNLAIGTALCKLHNIESSTQEIAASLGRGARSGIGISTFDLGGFIVDGGLKPNTTVPTFGNAGDIIDLFGEIINNSNDGVKVNIERVMNILPSNTWESSMCIGVCFPPNQDTASAIIAAGDTLDFSFHFFTDPLMLGPDTGRARVRFTNANSGQQYIIQDYKGLTYAPSTEITELAETNSKLRKIFNLLGKEEKQKTNP